MTAKAKEVKTGLLLIPAKIVEHHDMLEAFVISRAESAVDYERFYLDKEEIGKRFRHYTKEYKELLEKLNNEHIRFEYNQIKKTYSKQKSGKPLEQACHKAILRYLHGVFQQVIELGNNDNRYYHQTVSETTGKLRIAPCRFSKTVPSLHFDVISNEHTGLKVRAVVSIDDTHYRLADFVRNAFLLEKENIYYQLNYQDYLTLEWLITRNPDQYALQPAEFARNIIARLEESYTVNRNQLFEKKEIKEPPICNLHLSEISDTFLMLTPRWMYDGIVVEGEWKEVHETNRYGTLYAIHRDQNAEQQFRDYILDLHPNFTKQKNGFYYLSFADAKKKSWFLKAYHGLLEKDVEITGLEMLRHFRYSPYAADTVMEVVKVEENIVTINMRVAFGKEQIALSELQKMLLSGQRNLLLKDNSIAELTDEWIYRYSTILKHGKIEKSKITVARWVFLGVEEVKYDEQLTQVFTKEWWAKWQSWQNPDDIVYPKPAGIQADLRAYQQKGFEWMALMAEVGAGTCLADDMGLGKTLQTITFMAYQHEQNSKAKQLVVCPASLIFNWKQELEKFAPHLKPFIYTGAQRDLDKFFEEDAQVLISTYGAVRSDIDQLSAYLWQAIIIDESQNIKNPTALITKAVYQLNSKSRVALSGTPVMNNTFDLYAQLQFLLPGFFGSQEFFKREYATPIDKEHDKGKVALLQRMTAPFVLRRTKQQVATDLPPKTELVMWCEMDELQREVYDTVKNRVKESVFLNIKNASLGQSKLHVLQAIQKLRQICCSPVLLKDEETLTTESVKAEMLMDELKNNLRDNKVLVFSQFKGMLNILATQCEEQGIDFYHFDGDTPLEKRIEMVNAFQQDGNKVNVFFISLKSGNAGLNLTAADYVFLVDPWWNTAVQQQAIDRTHRIGQTKNVFAYKMICRGTIEERIIELQQRKKMLSDELISEDEGFVKNLTEDDVAYLFE